ncbi:SLC30A1 [Mytilus edulis]|uniref:SLC30A1 n=1 Tax=Mytilus edulis TaxID=6550 RepID=A0A8S3VLJ6_MYTED|nr:SLC30A1 [Mytilus edulis]
MGKYSGKTCRLLTMLGMTASFFLVEIIVGYVTNSIALVADSFHMLSDVVALIVGFASVRISKWQTHKNTFGWIRAEILGAFVNAVFLIALCFSILVESLKRLVEIEEIKDPKLLLIVGSLGLAVNLIGLCLFHEHGHSHGGGSHSHSHEKVALVDKAENGHVKNSNGKHSHGHGHSHTSALENSAEIDGVVIEMEDDPQTASGSQLNMRGVFLHVLGDALGSVIVIISALLIWFVEADWKYYMDPAMSILMVIIILSTTAPLLRDSGLILLQTVPGHIRVHKLKEDIEKIEGVLALHEFHVWQLAGNKIIASAHIHVHNLQEYMVVAEKLKDIFHKAGIHSTTIQPEIIDEFDAVDFPKNQNCSLECGPNKNCLVDTCCAPKSKQELARRSSKENSPTRSSPNHNKLKTSASSPCFD